MANPKPGLVWLRLGLRYLLVLGFGLAGIAHLRSPQVFVSITPDWVPYPEQVIIITGFCELAGAVALLIPPLRALAGRMLALYAICVFPANLHHALADIAIDGQTYTWWYHGPRLAFQPVIVWWSLFASGAIDWPFARSRSS